MRRTVPGELHGLVAPGMRTALPLGAVGDAEAALHGAIVAILVRALANNTLGFEGLVGGGPDALSMVPLSWLLVYLLNSLERG